MKKRALRKDFFMEIRKSLPRFLSIFFIVAMGVAFYSGIQASSPDMRLTGDYYFDKNNLMDLKVVSSMGLTEDDAAALKNVEGIADAEPGYMADVLESNEENIKVLRMESLPEKQNILTLEAGAMPVQANECFLDSEYAAHMEYEVGDTITVEETAEDEDDRVLKVHKFTIAGIGNSPMYISMGRGNTTIGNGEIAGFVFVPKEAFDYEVYTQIYLKVDGAQAETAYTDGYNDLIEAVEDRVDGIKAKRCEVRYAEIQDEADDKIKEAKQELADGRKEAEEKLQDAKDELDDAKKKLADGKEELADARKQLADGKATLQEKKAELADGKQQLADGYRQLQSGKEELAKKEAEFKKQKTSAETQITDGEKQLKKAKKELQSGQATFETQKQEFQKSRESYEQGLMQYNQQKAAFDDGKAQLTQLKENYQQLETLIAAGQATDEQKMTAAGLKAQIDAMDEQLRAADTELQTAKKQLDAVGPQITAGQDALDTAEAKLQMAEAEIEENEKLLQQSKEKLLEGENQLAEAKKTLAASEAQLAASSQQIADGEAQIAEAEQTIADNEAKVTDGEKELADNEKKLQDGEKEYEDAKADVEKEIKDGEKKIADAEADVADIKMPKWTITDRDNLTEYTGYGENADRMRNIGEVFPVLFFLVAALISLTTMTRMVEEERTQIGTLKALGYGKTSIAAKYLMYALLATLGGSIFGFLVGEKILPFIIIRAYGIMYLHMPDIVIPYNMKFTLMASAAAVACTMIATLAACMKELMASPAVLMRPPAPKQGRRVFMERITFIWKYLSFIWKSTIRNLFRYKKRFLMTIIGIGGCMGLLLVGFGLRDSIMDVAVLQYQNLQLYDGMAVLDEDASEDEKEAVFEEISRNAGVTKHSWGYMKKMDFEKGKKVQEGYIVVVPDQKAIQDLLNFKNRTTDEVYELNDDGIILTEKAAKVLNVQVGDSMELSEDDSVSVRVSSICENYMYHYVYMTESFYEKVYGTSPEYNSIFYRTSEDSYEAAVKVGEKVMRNDAVMSISYTGTIEDQLDDMLGSLDIVIVVIIISAGMLAFIVLYNLNNININERKRELATLKVLGFYDLEVSEYVYRENLLLTAIGCILGVFIGIVLHRFIITTVEVDVCMFGRNIYLSSFLLSVAITFGFSILVNLFMHFKLKRIDMVESLKSVE